MDNHFLAGHLSRLQGSTRAAAGQALQKLEPEQITALERAAAAHLDVMQSLLQHPASHANVLEAVQASVAADAAFTALT